MIKAVRGTRDLLPPDTELWNFVDRKVREVFARYNYHEIRTPLFESLSSSPAASAKKPTCLQGDVHLGGQGSCC